MNWYALAVKPQAERLVAAGLAQKNYETFFPVVSTTRRWSDRVKRIDAPLIPGYVFCRFHPEHRLPVITTPGVREVIGFGRQLAAVDEGELESLRRVVEFGTGVASCEFLERGDLVEVTAGSLRGLRGRLLEVKGECRVVVSVGLLQRSVSAEMDRAAVRRVEIEKCMTAGGWQ